MFTRKNNKKSSSRFVEKVTKRVLTLGLASAMASGAMAQLSPFASFTDVPNTLKLKTNVTYVGMYGSNLGTKSSGFKMEVPVSTGPNSGGETLNFVADGWYNNNGQNLVYANKVLMSLSFTDISLKAPVSVTSLSSSGTVSGANLWATGNISTATGTVSGANLTATGNISTTTGTVSGANLTATDRVRAGSSAIGKMKYSNDGRPQGHTSWKAYLGLGGYYDQPSNQWRTTSDGANAGGSFIIADNWGNTCFSYLVRGNNGGYAEQVFTEKDLIDNIKVRINGQNGTLYAKAVEVTASNWPDYVFKNDYKMKSLSEVEAYVNENSHLPGVPSASEVESKGLNLAQMNAALLEKVEELYLHSIKQQKEIDAMKAKLSELEK